MRPCRLLRAFPGAHWPNRSLCAAPPLVRLNKKIANSGICSRREADRLILDGLVSVRGLDPREVTPGVKVVLEAQVTVRNKPLPESGAPIAVVAYNKPKGELVTNRDNLGRRTIFDSLSAMNAPKGLKAIGRLDISSEGIILLTTNGQLARRLELPGTGVPRTYRVRVHGHLTEEKLRALRTGTVVEGYKYAGMDVVVERNNGKKITWLQLTCYEGKNRMIRKICRTLHLDVSRLIRTSFGPVQITNALREGVAVKVDVQELETHLRRYEALAAKRQAQQRYLGKVVRSKDGDQTRQTRQRRVGDESDSRRRRRTRLVEKAHAGDNVDRSHGFVKLRP